MSARRAIVPVLSAACVALALAAAAHAKASSDVSVIVERTRITTQLGRNVSLGARFENRASTASRSLVAHLNILSLRKGVEVDPEDWSTRRTRYLGTIPAGGSRTIVWPVHAITTGRIALYVAVLPQAGLTRPPTTGRTVQLVVAGRDTLNSAGILPLVLGIPVLLASIMGAIKAARRWR